MALFGIVGSTRAQVVCTPVFANEYQAYSNILPTAIKVLPDGTMLTAGMGLAGTSTNYDGFVARLNPDGTQIWSFFIGGNGDDNFSGITPLSDGTTILYGSTKSFGHPEGKGWLVHIDATGAVLASFLLGSTATSNDQVKVVQQYTDGDITGSFNVADGSTASDPVLFKMGLDGTLRWTHRFDDGDDDSFTGLAFSGDTLYAAGYYTAGGFKNAVITMVNAGTGSGLGSKNISYAPQTYQEEITGFEIYGGTISYGLYLTGTSGGAFSNEIILVQTDLASNLRHPTSFASDVGMDIDGFTFLTCIRTADSGFFVLRTLDGNGNYGNPAVDKINKYGVEEWGVGVTPIDNSSAMTGIDRTSDGGCVVAGWFETYLAGFSDVMRVVRMTASGGTGSCTLTPQSMLTDTITCQQLAFTWASESPIIPMSQATTPNASVAAPLSLLADQPQAPCSSSVCLDHTPIPTGCNKTYNFTYSSGRSSEINDVIPTTDGGRLGVGGLSLPVTFQVPQSDGLVVKFLPNGDVAWAKNYYIVPGYDLSFNRIVRLADGNLLAIGNDFYDVNHGANNDIVMMKFDNNGSVIWTMSSGLSTMSDVGATPDGGFILLNGAEVIRFDANANIVWQKTTTLQEGFPQYLSVFCSGNSVDLAFQSTTYTGQYGVSRLDFTTGNEVWSKAFTINGNSAAVNRIISIRDSVYLFMYNYVQYASVPLSNLVIKLDTLGNFYQAQTLGADAVTVTPSTVTLTSDGNFAIANQITVAGSNSFLITKVQPNGTPLWSNNFTSIPYIPYNIHTQGKGFIVPGVQATPNSETANFTISAMLKLDSSGQFEAGAAAGCQAAARPFIVTPFSGISPAGNVLTSVQSFTFPLVSDAMTPQDATLTPQLMCYTPGNCNAVTLEQKGAVCALGDTLVYYLDNSANCGAGATWNYDLTIFKPGIISGDSIQLIALQGGSTTVSAQVEGYCSLTLQNKTVNIALSTTNLNLGPDTVVCDHASVTLQASPGFTSYLWDDNSTGTSLVVTAPGKYYVTATDQCGGHHSDTVNVAAADSSFHLSPDSISCNQAPIPLQASGGYTDYQWSPDYNIQAQGNQALVSPGVTTLYTVTALRGPGCTVTHSALVTALSSPAVSLGDDSSICSGDSLLLDAGPLFNSYQWSTGATDSKIYVSQAGVYMLSVLYSNGCASRDTFQLQSLYTVVAPTLNKDSVLCVGTDRALDAGPGYASYLWNNGSTGSSLDISQPGIYWVSVKDQHGCVAGDTAHVVAMVEPPAGFLAPDTTICQYGDLVIGTYEPFVSYSWSDLSTGPSLTVTRPGVYWVQVTDNNGCTAKDSISVSGKECLVGLFVPNAFTPNGDGHNDRFKALYYGTSAHFDFTVFNRWGQKVFETQSPASAGWDGTINGTPSPGGVYVWYCRYQPDGQPEVMAKGTVILIR